VQDRILAALTKRHENYERFKGLPSSEILSESEILFERKHFAKLEFRAIIAAISALDYDFNRLIEDLPGCDKKAPRFIQIKAILKIRMAMKAFALGDVEEFDKSSQLIVKRLLDEGKLTRRACWDMLRSINGIEAASTQASLVRTMLRVLDIAEIDDTDDGWTATLKDNNIVDRLRDIFKSTPT
jgi:hypothetical protein